MRAGIRGRETVKLRRLGLRGFHLTSTREDMLKIRFATSMTTQLDSVVENSDLEHEQGNHAQSETDSTVGGSNMEDFIECTAEDRSSAHVLESKQSENARHHNSQVCMGNTRALQAVLDAAATTPMAVTEDDTFAEDELDWGLV